MDHKVTRKDLPHIQDLIAKADEELASYQADASLSKQECLEKCFDVLEQSIVLGKIPPAEGMVMLVALGYQKEISTQLQELCDTAFASYPQSSAVERALMSRSSSVPCYAFLEGYVADDFLEYYIKGSISFDELIYRLALLGRIPTSDYLRKSHKERKAMGTDIEYYHIW